MYVQKKSVTMWLSEYIIGFVCYYYVSQTIGHNNNFPVHPRNYQSRFQVAALFRVTSIGRLPVNSLEVASYKVRGIR